MIKDIAFLVRGKLKKRILEQVDEPKTPTQLSKLLKAHRSAVSRALIELEEKSMVKCLNPDDVMARFYQITPKGKKTLEETRKLFK